MTFDVVINLLCETHYTHGEKFILVPHQFEVSYNHGREKCDREGEREKGEGDREIDGDRRETRENRWREKIERGG